MIDFVESDPLSVILIDTMLPKNTAQMIVRVRKLREALPEATDYLFDSIEALVKAVVNEKQFQLEGICEVIRVNQGILKVLGVSCEAIDKVVSIAAEYGYVAKLTGGGGGGCVMAITEDSSNQEQLLNRLQEEGFKGECITLGGKGLIVDCLVS